MIKRIDDLILNGVFQKMVDRHGMDPKRTMSSSYRLQVIVMIITAIMTMAVMLNGGMKSPKVMICVTVWTIAILTRVWLMGIYIRRPSIQARAVEHGHPERLLTIGLLVFVSGMSLKAALEGRTDVTITSLLTLFCAALAIDVVTMYMHACRDPETKVVNEAQDMNVSMT